MQYAWLNAPNQQLMLSGTSTVTETGTRSFRGLPDTLRLLYAGSGDCKIALGAARERLIGDRMLLLRGEVSYRIEQSSEDLLLCQVDFSHTQCTPEGFSLHQLYRHYPDYREYCQSETEYLCFHDQFSLVRFSVKSLSQYTVYEQPHRGQLISMTLNYLMLVIASAAQEKTRQPYLYNRHVRRAIQYMHENYMCNITADDIASYVGVHSGHLHRLFRTEIGVRITEYLTNLRLEKAKTLLKRTDIPINIVAEFVGISSQQYLSRLFKQHVGMTPQEYRRSYNITCDYTAAQARYETTVYPMCKHL